MPQTVSTLKDIVEPGAKVEKVLSGYQFTEGPAFSRLGFLLFSDVTGNRIYKYVSGGQAEVFRGNSNAANGLTFDRQGRLLACEEATGRITRTEKDGSITVLAEKFEGKALNSPNDLVHAIDNSIYFTDIRWDAKPGDGKVQFSAVYRIKASHGAPATLRLATREMGTPNGVALSSNQQTLYIADSERQHVQAYDIAPDGSLTRGRIVAEMKHSQRGGPDGLKTDENGTIYVAGHGGVWVFKDGRHLGTIETPEKPSNVAWGDNYRTLYITASTSVYKIRLKATGTRTF